LRRYRYYCTVREPSTFAQDSLATPAEEKEAGIAYLSSDITLTALTQLGIYRFGCNRSFVSLTDGENQHIISEATASISLRDRERHRELDGLYLGVTTLDLNLESVHMRSSCSRDRRCHICRIRRM
jgi:hypothetical protein